LIDEKSWHKKIKRPKNVWYRVEHIRSTSDIVFKKFKDLTTVLFHRDDGIHLRFK